MKKYVLLHVILSIFILTGFILYLSLPKNVSNIEVDYVAVNEIVRQTELTWENPENTNDFVFKYDFVVFDNEGNMRYISDESLPGNIPLAVRRGLLPMLVRQGSYVMGQIFIETSFTDMLLQAQTRLIRASLIIFLLFCFLNFIFLLLLHNTLIKPFKSMENFAHKISIGIFDEPLPMDKQNLFGLFTQSFDIMRASLFEARKNQLNTERAKKELIASLSHDIKTPLTSIKVITEYLQASVTDPCITEKLKTIEIKADQIDRLMNDMLHSALDELDELKVNITGAASGILRDLFRSSDYLVKIRIGDIPPCMIDIDVVRMEQVIGNIIINSYKYAGTDIDVSFIINGDYLQVDIADYGKGVEKEELELILAKFYRGKNAKASQKSGEGLGLYISKKLMEKMGGGFEAFNRDNGFTVRLYIRLSF